MKQRILRLLLATAVTAAITLGLLEVALRLMPTILPPPILVRFNDEIRREIATDRGFMTQQLTIPITRDDGGPELRVLKPHTEISYPEAFAFANDPGAVLDGTMDEKGFCNPDGLYTATPTFDIITIGDSLTWCHTVTAEDTFSYLLAEATDYTVYNLGKGGVGLYEYLQILKTFGLEKQPAIVVMNVYEGNDLRDALEYWQAVTERDAGTEDTSSSTIALRDAIKNSFIGRRSYAVNLLIASASYAYSYAAYPEERLGQTIDFSYRVRTEGGEVAFNSRNVDVDEVIHAIQLERQDIDLDVFTDALTGFVELSSDHGFVPVVTYIPSAHSAYQDALSFTDPGLEQPMRNFSSRMRAYFGRMGDSLGFTFIDLTPDMQAAAASSSAGELLYFPTNLHLTRAGHEVIARRLTSELASRSPSTDRQQ